MKQPRLALSAAPRERRSVVHLIGLTLVDERGSTSCWRYQPRRSPIRNPLRVEVLPPHSDCLEPVGSRHGGQPGREPGASRHALVCPARGAASRGWGLMPGGLVTSRNGDRRRVQESSVPLTRGATPRVRRRRRGGGSAGGVRIGQRLPSHPFSETTVSLRCEREPAGWDTASTSGPTGNRTPIVCLQGTCAAVAP